MQLFFQSQIHSGIWLFCPLIFKGLYWNISEKAMASHSTTLAWKIPWTEEPGRLQSMGSRRVRHDWATSLSLFTFMQEMATHSSVLAWRIPGMEEPGGLPSIGSHRVRHDWSDLAAAAAAFFISGEGNGNPLQYSCLANPMDRGAWWAAVYRVAQSRIRLKRLSSSSRPCSKYFTTTL